MSKAVNIHPLVVAVAVASGTLLAGLVGAVVAVPVVSVIYGVLKFWFQTAPPKPGSAAAEDDDDPPSPEPESIESPVAKPELGPTPSPA